MFFTNRRSLRWTNCEAALCAAAWMLFAGLIEGQTQDASASPAPSPSPPVSPAPAGGGSPKQPWWMLLILVAVAFLVILLVVIVTFSVSWCFQSVRSRTESYAERSEASQLSVTAAAWTNAAAVAANRRPYQHRASSSKCRAASLELVQSLPMFKYKDAPAVLPFACLREVVVHVPHSCSEDGCCDSARSSGEVLGGCTRTPKHAAGHTNAWPMTEAAATASDARAESAAQLTGSTGEAGVPCKTPSTASLRPDSSMASLQGLMQGSSAVLAPLDPACLCVQPAPPSASSITAPAADPGVCCAVCLADYTPECLLRGLPCGHCFHMDCVDHWLLQGGSCPVCRCPLTSQSGDAQGQPA